MDPIEIRYTFAEYHAERMAAQGGIHGQRDQLLVGALGLGGETGEVLELVKKHFYHGKDLDREKMLLELGDVLWYIMFSADAIGFTLEDVALANSKKLRARYPNGFSVEAARAKPDSTEKLGLVGYDRARQAFYTGHRVDIVSECEGGGYQRAWDGWTIGEVFYVFEKVGP